MPGPASLLAGQAAGPGAVLTCDLVWWRHAPSGLVYRLGQHAGVVATYECGLDGSLRECLGAEALPAQGMHAVAVLWTLGPLAVLEEEGEEGGLQSTTEPG